jgi:hypothetical protein
VTANVCNGSACTISSATAFLTFNMLSMASPTPFPTPIPTPTPGGP